MAKQLSFLKFSGNIGGLNFAKRSGEYIVREKPVIPKSRIETGLEYIRTRENMVEFGNVQSAQKIFNHAFQEASRGISDSLATNRVTSMMAEIKNLDKTVVRGKREVNKGMQTVGSKSELLGFNFNKKSLLKDVLHHSYSIDVAQSSLIMTNLNPAKDINKPNAATAVGFTLFHSLMDFSTGETIKIQSEEIMINLLDETEVDLTLGTVPLPDVPGVHIFVLRIEFYKQTNAEFFQKLSCGYSVGGVVGVE